MEELGLHPADRQVYFGQLLGMCDQISFPLGEGPPWGGAGAGPSACRAGERARSWASLGVGPGAEERSPPRGWDWERGCNSEGGAGTPGRVAGLLWGWGRVQGWGWVSRVQGWSWASVGGAGVSGQMSPGVGLGPHHSLPCVQARQASWCTSTSLMGP